MPGQRSIRPLFSRNLAHFLCNPSAQSVCQLSRTQAAAKAVFTLRPPAPAAAGIGPTKARRLHDTFHQPFRRAITAMPQAAAAAATPIGQQPQPPQQQAAVGPLPAGLQEATLDDEAEGGSGLRGEGSEDDDFI